MHYVHTKYNRVHKEMDDSKQLLAGLEEQLSEFIHHCVPVCLCMCTNICLLVKRAAREKSSKAQIETDLKAKIISLQEQNQQM